MCSKMGKFNFVRNMVVVFLFLAVGKSLVHLCSCFIFPLTSLSPCPSHSSAGLFRSMLWSCVDGKSVCGLNIPVSRFCWGFICVSYILEPQLNTFWILVFYRKKYCKGLISEMYFFLFSKIIFSKKFVSNSGSIF